MWKEVSQLLLTGQLTWNKGKISLFKEHGGILPMSGNIHVLKALEKKGLENILYQGSKETGINWNKKMLSQYKANKPEQIFKWGEIAVTLAGWGTFKVHKYDFDKNEFIYRLEDSIYSQYYEKSDHPIDHLVRGLFAGSVCFLTKKNMEAVEVKCKAMGDPFCEFVIKERKAFNMKDKLVAKQLKKV